MNRVDFYLLKSSTFSDQIGFCCRLSEKALAQQNKIHIQTKDTIHSDALNEALWSFKADSFLPHAIGQNQYQDYPITIDSQALKQESTAQRDLLILLCSEIPRNHHNFDRMCVIVTNQESDIQLAREQYRHFKKQGLKVNIHDMRNELR
ncbi:MAG: DNA polymerase-3 subunit chi [Pseudohongiellaceae bacterium]|jgi:DNA polymerase-3 subunit chi